MNIYLSKYLKYKKKYYKIKYGGKIENNSIEIFRCYLDILLYKLDIEKKWSEIRNSKEYKEVTQKYEETTNGSTKNEAFFENMYDNTPFLSLLSANYLETQSLATIVYDKYIRVGNKNVCMPHGIKLREVCKENDEFYKWHDPNDPDNEKKLNPQEIGKNIGKEKILSHLKYTDEKFNNLSKIKYIIERCLFNSEYTDKEKIKAIIVPLGVNALYEEAEIRSEECNLETTNHANMFLIKINRTEDNEIKLVLQYFDPNAKQAVYLQKRFKEYMKKINEVADGYEITGVEELNLDIKKSAIKYEELGSNKSFLEGLSAIHAIFPHNWVTIGICGSVTWIIFILWTKVCSVVKDFDDFYDDIIDILIIQYWQDYINRQSINEYTKNNLLNLIDSRIGDDKKKKIKECYIDFLYIIYMFLNNLNNSRFINNSNIQELYKLKYNQLDETQYLSKNTYNFLRVYKTNININKKIENIINEFNKKNDNEKMKYLNNLDEKLKENKKEIPEPINKFKKFIQIIDSNRELQKKEYNNLYEQFEKTHNKGYYEVYRGSKPDINNEQKNKKIKEIKEIRNKYEDKIKELLKSSNSKIDEKLKELINLKEPNKLTKDAAEKAAAADSEANEAKKQAEAEAKAKEEAEAKAAREAKQEAEAKAKQEAEAKAKQEAEAKAKQEAREREERKKKKTEAAERKRKEEEAKQEAEAKDGVVAALEKTEKEKDAEAKAKQEAERKRRKAAEEEAAREAEEKKAAERKRKEEEARKKAEAREAEKREKELKAENINIDKIIESSQYLKKLFNKNSNNNNDKKTLDELKKLFDYDNQINNEYNKIYKDLNRLEKIEFNKLIKTLQENQIVSLKQKNQKNLSKLAELINKKLIQLNKINKDMPLSRGGFMLKNNNIKKKKIFTEFKNITKYLKYKTKYIILKLKY